jgi:hypothetical protein
MDCEKCQNGKPVGKGQLIQDLIDYLDYIGVTKESIIATLIDMQERSKYLTPPPIPFMKD